MNRILKVSGLLLMWGVFYACTEAGMAMHEIQKTAKATAEMESDVPMVVAAQLGLLRVDVDASIANLSNILDKQLTESNKQIAKTSKDGLAKVGVSLRHLNTAIDATANAVGSINTVASNPEIPKLIHDARLTTAFAGQAAVHVESMANDLDKATPGFLKSAQEIADSGIRLSNSGADIAHDFKVVTDKAVAPQPWPKAVLSYALPFVKLGSVFF